MQCTNQKLKLLSLFSHVQPSDFGRPSLCCTIMNAHNWIQKDSLTQKMIFHNIPHKLQQWDQYIYTYIAFSFAKAHNVYKFYKFKNWQESKHMLIEPSFMISLCFPFSFCNWAVNWTRIEEVVWHETVT